jgi:hypothetical protein
VYPECSCSGRISYNRSIITFHGLGGHWKNTWTDANGSFWPRDFVPLQLPQAGIMAFGYNTNTAFSKATTDIEQVANMLMIRVHGCRQLPEERTRPIIFICHSLGGIVMKKAGQSPRLFRHVSCVQRPWFLPTKGLENSGTYATVYEDAFSSGFLTVVLKLHPGPARLRNLRKCLVLK